MKLKVNVWQRQALIQLVGGVRGNVAVIRKASKVLDVLEMTDAEKEEVGFQVHPNGMATWQNTDVLYDLEVKDKEASGLLKRMFEEKEDWPAVQASLIIDLANQMGVEEE